jgi:mono/diheme cytochrome c family protein
LNQPTFYLISNMSPSNQKPDLDESINVAEAHGRVVREAAACARENRIVQNGIQPVALWVTIACGITLLIAGGVLGIGGDFFAYGATFRPGYERTPAPGVADAGPKPKTALAAYESKGAKIFSAKCSGCHGSDARGNGSTYPSLVGAKWPNGETERFAMIILNGLHGPAEDGKVYGVMPPQGIGMTPEDLAGIMTYVRNNFGNTKGDVVTKEMAKAAIDISAKRANAGNGVTKEELDSDHLKNLPGVVMSPTALVDAMTLEPVAATKKP